MTEPTAGESGQETVYRIHMICNTYETTDRETARVHRKHGFKVTTKME